MKFNDAWEEVLKNIPKDCRPKGDPQMIAMIWSIIAVALSKKGLDDLSYISQNKQIISIPLQKSSTKTAKVKTKAKVEKTDGKEEKETTKKPTD